MTFLNLFLTLILELKMKRIQSKPKTSIAKRMRGGVYIDNVKMNTYVMSNKKYTYFIDRTLNVWRILTSEWDLVKFKNKKRYFKNAGLLTQSSIRNVDFLNKLMILEEVTDEMNQLKTRLEHWDGVSDDFL